MEKRYDLIDITLPCRRDGPGYVTKDDILSFPVFEGDPTYRTHYVIPLDIKDRLVVDALGDVLLIKAKSFIDPKVHMYGKTLIPGDIKLSVGIGPGLRKEFNSWTGVHSVAVFDMHEALSRVELKNMFDTLKQSFVHADPRVLKFFECYFDVANGLLPSLSHYSGTPYQGFPLIGSLPLVILGVFSSLDTVVSEIIGDGPYVRLNYEYIFPIFGDSPSDEEPYLQ